MEEGRHEVEEVEIQFSGDFAQSPPSCTHLKKMNRETRRFGLISRSTRRLLSHWSFQSCIRHRRVTRWKCGHCPSKCRDECVGGDFAVGSTEKRRPIAFPICDALRVSS